MLALSPVVGRRFRSGFRQLLWRMCWEEVVGGAEMTGFFPSFGVVFLSGVMEGSAGSHQSSGPGAIESSGSSGCSAMAGAGPVWTFWLSAGDPVMVRMIQLPIKMASTQSSPANMLFRLCLTGFLLLSLFLREYRCSREGVFC